jgi:hypothetical protein
MIAFKKKKKERKKKKKQRGCLESVLEGARV